MKQEKGKTRQNQEKTHPSLGPAQRYYYNPDASGHDAVKHEENHAKLVFLAEKNPVR